MWGARFWCGVLAFACLWLGPARPSIAGADAFKIIVHPDNPIATIDRGFLRRAYLKKVIAWSDGRAIHPVDLGERPPARARFTRDVLQKTPSQLRSYWNQQIFSGKGVPPPSIDSTAAVIAYVRANRGAVAYLPADVDPGGAKVVELQ